MTFFIITFHHKHGFDTWPHFGAEAPGEDEIIKGLREEGSWDDDDENRIDTYIDVTGPFQPPAKN
jgi:hypothetical protein